MQPDCSKHASLPPQGGGTGIEPDPRGHHGWGSTVPMGGSRGHVGDFCGGPFWECYRL